MKCSNAGGFSKEWLVCLISDCRPYLKDSKKVKINIKSFLLQI